MFVISLALAHRLLPCVSTEETRFYLNGVGVDLCKSGGARLVATDGHVMGIFRDHEAHGTFDGVAIVSRHAIADAFKAARKEARGNDPSSYWLLVDDSGQGSVVLAPSAGAAVAGRNEDRECPILWRSLKSVLVDGTFPDYMRVMPGEAHELATAPGWNAALLGRFNSIVNVDAKGTQFGVSLLSGSPDGGAPWFVLSAGVPDFVGIAMPMRNGLKTFADLITTARDVLDRPAVALKFIAAPETAKVDA